jgi:hypothetical protein
MLLPTLDGSSGEVEDPRIYSREVVAFCTPSALFQM